MTGDREVLLVAGGSPLALAIAEQLDDPAVRVRYEEAFRQLAEFAARTVEEVGRAFAALVEAYAPVVEHLRESGVLPEVPPEDPRARALWLVQHRGTGPDRPSGQRAHAPRRIG